MPGTLRNIKTGKTQRVQDPDKILKKYKGVFKLVPAAQVSEAVKSKEKDLATKSIEVKDVKSVASKDKKTEK